MPYRPRLTHDSTSQPFVLRLSKDTAEMCSRHGATWSAAYGLRSSPSVMSSGGRCPKACSDNEMN